MFYWQPAKWLGWGLLGVGLPFLGGSIFSTNSLLTDISTRAAQAAGGDWAKLTNDGRDFTLTGTAPSKDAVDAIAKTPGVRLLNTDGVKVAEAAPAAPALTAPVITAATTDANGTTITGTYPDGVAKTLDVSVNDKTYSLGKSPELTADKGNWTLKLATGALAAGAYKLSAVDGDGTTTMTADAAKAPKLEIAAPALAEPLAAPTITAAKADDKGATITGTWPEGKAKTLDVAVNDKVYTLGKNPELTSDNGNWTLALPAGALAAGAYKVTAKDGDGDKAMAAADKPVELAIAPPKPEPLVPPTITATKADDKGATINGTWDEGKAKSLDVKVDDKTYTLGKAPELTSSGGKWTLAVPALAAGAHQITASEGDGQQTAAAPTPAQVTVAPPPAKPPAAPTVEQVSSNVDHPTVKGTWPVGKGNTLQVQVDGKVHTLGKDYDLLSDTAGHWTLTPKDAVINGTYDVIAKVTAADGQSSTNASKNDLTVNVPPPPPPPPKEAPYDCAGALAKTLANEPVRFEYDKSDLTEESKKALADYAAILKDDRCKAVKIQVTGHTDFIGTEAYNQKLSEHRASAAEAELVNNGVEAARLSAVGFGKTKPLDDGKSDEARARNRRDEFVIQ